MGILTGFDGLIGFLLMSIHVHVYVHSNLAMVVYFLFPSVSIVCPWWFLQGKKNGKKTPKHSLSICKRHFLRKP